MAMNEVAVRYAEALAESAGLQAEDAENELLAINSLFTSIESLRVFFESPGVETSLKLQKLKTIFQGKCQPNILNLLLLLAERNRLNLLNDVATEFTTSIDKRLGRIPVFVTVPGKYAENGEILSPEQIEKIENAVLTNKTEFGISNVASPKFKTSAEVRPEILAGIKIRVGDNVFDASAGSALQKWRNRIVQMPVDTKGINWFSE